MNKIRETASHKSLVAGAAILALVLAGCGGPPGTSDASGEGQQAPSAAPAANGPGDSSTTADAGTSDAGARGGSGDRSGGDDSRSDDSGGDAPRQDAPKQAVPSGDRGGSAGTCLAADLELALGAGEGTAGTHYRPLRFTNVSDSPCVIHGFPGVSYVAGDDGHQVGTAAYRTGAKGDPVTLRPGSTAHADVGFVQVRNYDPAECKPTPVRGLRVYPPHETNSMYVRAPGTGCAEFPDGQQLTVATVEPGR
ncbi:Protein of unknown function (DUF4232) [Prauserella aidingensis]|uniref:DUF4232 domain-containing protein n=1 Tax=Prauserella aidingensis TaxID=387890 RepID=UPI0020A5CDCE|nr:DUF4232 domain-containing protein [Prauserella aidingensis]MCP2255534.1 Protein of unknown function (DUF4232) [Prauserella aidingensis]